MSDECETIYEYTTSDTYEYKAGHVETVKIDDLVAEFSIDEHVDPSALQIELRSSTSKFIFGSETDLAESVDQPWFNGLVMCQANILTFVSLRSSCKRTLEDGISEPNSGKQIHAKIYKWKFTPPFTHVLANCCYIGQTEQPLSARTKQHKNKSIRDPKELGLHSLWRQYPCDSYWEISLVEEGHFDDRVSAGQWMNEREVALIAEHGGKLRDMDKQLHQTLNLTLGGQGDPRKVFEALLARSRKQLNKIRPAFQQFYDREAHLRIPRGHEEVVNGKPVKLGKIVDNIRGHKYFLQFEDFRQWLDSHDFVYDEPRAHLEMDVRPAFEQFYDRERHLRILREHKEDVNGETVPLGKIVHGIRSREAFLYFEDFRQWLDSHDFVYDEPRAHLEMDVWPAFKQFYVRKAHLRIPQSHEEVVNGKPVKLGKIVDNIRGHKYFLQFEDFAMWLWCACFKLHAKNGDENTRRWTQVFATK